MAEGAEIVAAGLVTCFGRGVERTWRALLEGRSGFRARRFSEVQSEAVVAAVSEAKHPWVGAGEDRALALCRLASDELRATGALEGISPARLGVALGSTQGAIESWAAAQSRLGAAGRRPPLPHPSAPAFVLARQLGAGGPLANPSVACASGAVAVGLGLSWLRRGDCDAVVAGGVDALSGFVHAGFAALRALDPVGPRPFDRGRAGLGLGEAAVLLLLRRAEAVGRPRITGFGCASDAHHLTGPDPSGQGAARAMNAALADAGLSPSEVDLVSAHGTATPYNDLMEAQALLRLFGSFEAVPPVSSIKGAVGHTLAAAGALEALVCHLALLEGVVPPTVGFTEPDPAIPLDVVAPVARRGDFRSALSLSAGFGGINAALVLEAAGR